MKRVLALLLCALLFCLPLVPALADTYYVATEDGSPLSLRDEATNAVLTSIPYGVPVVPDPNKSTDICAYVSYAGHSGLVLWRYLSRTLPSMQPAAENSGPVSVSEPSPAAPELPDGTYALTAVGALIKHVDTREAGVTSMNVTKEDNVTFTAQIPKNSKISYWVINGVRYDFIKNVRILRMTKFDRSYTVEVVYSKTEPQTLLSPEAIQAARTGETLEVTTKNCKISHVKANFKSGGGWMRSFDFTGDYTNKATGGSEQGGQLSLRVRADSSGSQKAPAGTVVTKKTVRGWRFNQTEVFPNVEVPEFAVHTLNVPMYYEPIFGGSSFSVTHH